MLDQLPENGSLSSEGAVQRRGMSTGMPVALNRVGCKDRCWSRIIHGNLRLVDGRKVASSRREGQRIVMELMGVVSQRVLV